MITTSSGAFAFEPHKKIAHYRLLSKIGQGGMSTVYEAFDERLQRSIAIKLLHPFLAEMPEYRARFFREAQACARLAHPNILQIFDVASSEKNAELYIVTELLSGGTLKERADALNAFLLPELGAMIIVQVAHALEHAHQKGIVHRDIKPENIMLTNEGQIKLMDFGIASIGSEESLTQAGSLLGSLAHIAPELLKGDKATPQSDIYSLSTVFYWLLTKKLPFNADSPHALLKAIADSEQEKPQLLSPYICDGLAALIERGMSKDPKMRFASAQDLALAIEAVLASLGVNPDTKKLNLVLSDPEQEFLHFKDYLLTDMAAQKKAYEEKKANADALILQCRLDAAGATPIKSLLNQPPKKHRYTGLLSLGLASLTLLPLNIGDAHVVKEKTTVRIALPVIETEIPAATVEPPPIAVPEESSPSQTKALEKIALKALDIVIWPFATVFLNGKMVARDRKRVQLNLKPGTYQLKFSHTYAATVEKSVIIEESDTKKQLTIIMSKSKPAFLVVKSNINADIAIDGAFKGTSAKSTQRPIVIPMPDKTHALSKEILIQEQGFKPYKVTAEFIAGQTKNLSVKLVPLVGIPVE